jgi:phage-related protein
MSVKDDMGNALGIAQFGETAPTAKPWKGLGPGVLEIVESHDGNAYRAVHRSIREGVVRPPRLREKVAVGHPDR